MKKNLLIKYLKKIKMFYNFYFFIPFTVFIFGGINIFDIYIPIPDRVSNVKMSVVGDLMLHSEQIDNAYRGNNVYDFDYCFEKVTPYFADSDLVVGNLETVFGGNIGYTGYPRFNAPDAFAWGIKHAGFHLLTTANNHSNDKGENAIRRTIDVLNSLEIDNVGTYKSQEERDAVFIKEIKGIRFAFLSYTYGTNGLPTPKGKDYLVNILNEDLIKSDIARAKALEPDFIVVLPHMGNEYETYPKQVFKDWVMMMFKSGADIVMASHPHVLQPAEFLEVDGRTCFVAYSMGNFISAQRTHPRDEGAIFNLYFEKINSEKPTLKKVSFVPTWVKFINGSGQYDIQVLPVYDTLTAVVENLKVDLRPKDIERLKQVQKNVTGIFLNEPVGIDNMRSEYIMYEAE